MPVMWDIRHASARALHRTAVHALEHDEVVFAEGRGQAAIDGTALEAACVRWGRRKGRDAPKAHRLVHYTYVSSSLEFRLGALTDCAPGFTALRRSCGVIAGRARADPSRLLGTVTMLFDDRALDDRRT